MDILKIVLLIMASASLVACKVELTSEDEDEGNIIEYVFDKSGRVDVIDINEEYDLTITGSNNKLDIKGNLRNLSITDSENQVYLLEYDDLDSITITASSSVIDAPDIDVEKIVISGDKNQILVNTCDDLSIAGSDNVVISMDEGECDEITTFTEDDN
jgi:ribosomal protein S4E